MLYHSMFVRESIFCPPDTFPVMPKNTDVDRSRQQMFDLYKIYFEAFLCV